MSKTTIKVDNLGVKFNLGIEKGNSLKNIVLSSIKRELLYDEFWALRNVSFELKEGDRLGILGLNGAGKSTLLKLISGVYTPSEGKIISIGQITALLELGGGFEKKYTGRENIYLYGAMLEYSKEYIDAKYNEIVEFSELGRFIDVPVENYSSGMKAKLGFSIATVTNPDILILDEVLAVGDAKFKKKSKKKLMSLIQTGTTVMLVTHSLGPIRKLCNKAMILEKGRMVAFGDMESVVQQYEQIAGNSDLLWEI